MGLFPILSLTAFFLGFLFRISCTEITSRRCFYYVVRTGSTGMDELEKQKQGNLFH